MRDTITVLAVVVALLVSGAVAVATVPEATAGNDDSQSDDDATEFIIEDVSAPGYGTVGENVTVNVTVTNAGDEGTDTVEVGLSGEGGTDGEVTETREVRLDANETRTISVDLSTDDLEDGSYYTYAATSGDEQATTVRLIDLEKIDAEPVCVDHDENTATFRVTNGNDQNVYVFYRVDGSDEGGQLFVMDQNEEYVTVPTDEGGNVNVTFYYGGADEHDPKHVELETVASDPDQECSERERSWDEENVTLTADCYDPVDNRAKYTLTNDNDEPITFEVAGSSATFNVTVGANSEETFTVSTSDDGDGLARVYWTGGVENETQLIAAKDANTDVQCDLGEPNKGDAYQVDLDFGEVIRDLGADEESFYDSDGSLIQARNFHERGNATHSYQTPDHDETARATVANGTVHYDAVSFDGQTGEATVNVSLAADADGPVTITFAVYELPDGTIEYQRDRADEQELLDHITVTLDPGESRTLTVDTDG